VNPNPFERPNVNEVRDAIHHARKVFTVSHLNHQAQMYTKMTGNEPPEKLQHEMRLGMHQAERIGPILTKILLKDCFCDEKKSVIFDSIKYFQDNLPTVMKRVKDNYPELSSSQEKQLTILGKYVSSEIRDDDLISPDVLALISVLIEKIPEKEVFIIFDMLRVLFLSHQVTCLIIHSHPKLLQIFEEKFIKVFDSLTIAPTKLMIFRVVRDFIF
jgi:hypothetical protein